MTSTTTATPTLVYRGVPHQQGEQHQATARRSAAMLTYRGVSYSTGSGGYRLEATPMACPLHRVIELQFLGNPYQRVW